MSFELLSHDTIVDIMEHSFDKSQYQSLGTLMRTVKEYENIYYESRTKGVSIPPFINRRVMSIVAKRLGFKLALNAVCRPAGDYWGLLQYNYVDDTHNYKYWGYHLLQLDPSKENKQLVMRDNYGNFINIIKYDYIQTTSKYLLIEKEGTTNIFSYDSSQNIVDEGMISGRIIRVYESITSKGPVLMDIRSTVETFVNIKENKHWKRFFMVRNGTVGYDVFYGQQLDESVDFIPLESIKFVGLNASEIKDYDFIVISRGYGIEVVVFTETFRTKIVLIAFCTAVKNILTVVWSSRETYQSITDFLVVFKHQIRDLITGDVLCDLTNHYTGFTSAQIICGVTKKQDHTGYYIWLDKSDIMSDIRWEIYQQLKREGINNGQIISTTPEFPETRISIKRKKDNAINQYLKYAHRTFTNYDLTMPFPMLSIYTLYPYFHKLATGNNILVLVIPRVFDKTLVVLGYNKNGHRTYKRYYAGDINSALQNIYKSHSNDQLLFFDSETEKLIIKWVHIVSNSVYSMMSKEDKLKRIIYLSSV